jgi:soluble lytic murein transglycosylase-like protein
LGIAEGILVQSQVHHLPPELILSVIKKETNHNPAAISKKGAMGIMQIMPVTWDEYVNKLNLGVSRQAAFDPIVNIKVGVYVLRDLFEHYRRHCKTEQDTWVLTLSAYYSGRQDIARKGLRSRHLRYISDVIENQK